MGEPAFHQDQTRAAGRRRVARGRREKIVILAHGFTGNKSESDRLFVTAARSLAASGITALRFDFMGSGDSSGEFYEMSPNTEIRDLLDVIAWTRRKKFRADRPAIDVPQAYCSLRISKLQIQGDADLPGLREEFTLYFSRAKAPKKQIVILGADHVFTNWRHRKKVIAETLNGFCGIFEKTIVRQICQRTPRFLAFFGVFGGQILCRYPARCAKRTPQSAGSRTGLPAGI